MQASMDNSNLFCTKRSHPDSFVKSSKILKLDEIFKENICSTKNSYLNKQYTETDQQNLLKSVKATPKKHLKVKDEPITPNTNMKLLTSLAATLDYAACFTPKHKKQEFKTNRNENIYHDIKETMKIVKTPRSRKEKSLALVCFKFLELYPLNPDPEMRIVVSLDDVSQKLNVERRRLYDIVNVFESIDMLNKLVKNCYIWYGTNNLIKCLKLIKASALKEGLDKKLEYVLKFENSKEYSKQSCILDEVEDFSKNLELEDESEVRNLRTDQIAPKCEPHSLVRKEKSLAIMSQRFLMLFLVSPSKVISLGVAAKVLNGFQLDNRGAQIKTQIRRLYDIANVLSSIGLIKKEMTVDTNKKKPAFRYIGPDLDDFEGKENVPLNRSPHYLNKNIKPRSLIRHSSFQEICAVAEMEHQKLCEDLDDAPKSAPPFEKNMIDKYNKNIQADWNFPLSDSLKGADIPNSNLSTKSVEISETAPIGSSSTLLSTIQKTMKPVPVVSTPQTMKILNVPKVYTNNGQIFVLNSAIPYSSSGNLYVLKDCVPIKCVNEIKPKSPDKVEKSHTIHLSPAQRDLILKSLNISLTENQVAAIEITGGSASSDTNTSPQCNMVKITEKYVTPIDFKQATKTVLTPNSSESNESVSVNSTRNNSPSFSSSRHGSPLSIPSGYATPIPSSSSDITSFPSGSEVDYILRKLENSKDRTYSRKFKSQRQIFPKKLNDFNARDHVYQISDNVSRESVSQGKSSKKPPKNLDGRDHVYHISDNCSSDSLNAEVSDILKESQLGNVPATLRSHSFLIDEKTILSPIKKPSDDKPSTPSPLMTPPYSSDNVFGFKPLFKFPSKIILNSQPYILNNEIKRN